MEKFMAILKVWDCSKSKTLDLDETQLKSYGMADHLLAGLKSSNLENPPCI